MDDQQDKVIEKLDLLVKLVDDHTAELSKIKGEMSSIEEKFVTNNLPNVKKESVEDESTSDDESGFKSNEDAIVLRVDKLTDYNYIEWARSVVQELRRMKLKHYLHDSPTDLSNSSEIAKDEAIKKAILSAISSSSKAKIDLASCTSTKKLWLIIKHRFFDEFMNRKDFNINYITRKDALAISELKCHVNQFRQSVVELIAIELRFNENILINLFMNTLTKNLPKFRSMIKRYSQIGNLNFTEILDYAASQAHYFLQILHSKEPIELDQQKYDVIDHNTFTDKSKPQGQTSELNESEP